MTDAPSSTEATAATTSTSSVSIPTEVPPGTVVEGDYSGPLRPQVHFSPPKDNPTALVAGNQHWGHATSDDLYHWKNQPIALFPPDNTSGIFTGSLVIDANNTSGFFSNATDGVDNVVAIYTLNTPEKEVQNLAYSLDGGYTFETYEGNPVIDSNTTQFRDPKVIWHAETQRWVMVVAYPQDFTIAFYTSTDLKNWKRVSDFSHAGLRWECPNFIEMPVKGTDETRWVLFVSINPGAPQGGSAGQYFIGDFDGTTFTAQDAAARLANFGKDQYADQWFYGAEEPISLAWASNWQYGQQVPTDVEGWRSAFTLPRQNFLVNATRVGLVLGSLPYQLDTVRDSSLLADGADTTSVVNQSVSVDYSSLESGAVAFSIDISLPTNVTIPSTATLNLTFSSSETNESLSAGYFFGNGDGGFAWVDRGKTNGFENPFFTDKFSHASASLVRRIEGVLDRTLFELFLDEGAFSATVDVYPTKPLDTLVVGSNDMPEGTEVELKVWGLTGTW
ncbi:Invertase [Rhodosporidiobolus nylandii]